MNGEFYLWAAIALLVLYAIAEGMGGGGSGSDGDDKPEGKPQAPKRKADSDESNQPGIGEGCPWGPPTTDQQRVS